MDRRAGILTASVPTRLSLHLLPPTDRELQAAERGIPCLSGQTSCGAGWSQLTVSSPHPRCPQAGAHWVSLGAGRPPSHSILLHHSTSPQAETSTPHPAETQVGPKPRRGVPRRRCTPSHSACRGRAPWWSDHHEKEMDTSFISDLGEKCTSSVPSPYFSISAEAFFAPRFFLNQFFSSCFFPSLSLHTMIIFPREQP